MTEANLRPALDFLSFTWNNAEGFPGYFNINDSGAFNCKRGPSLQHNRAGDGGALFNAIDYLS